MKTDKSGVGVLGFAGSGVIAIATLLFMDSLFHPKSIVPSVGLALYWMALPYAWILPMIGADKFSTFKPKPPGVVVCALALIIACAVYFSPIYDISKSKSQLLPLFGTSALIRWAIFLAEYHEAIREAEKQ